jgi:hypothetical protein
MSAASITGRDAYIILQALTTAYALIGNLPPHCQEESNRHDMAEILRARLGPDWKILAHQLRHVVSENEWENGKAPLRSDTFESVA